MYPYLTANNRSERQQTECSSLWRVLSSFILLPQNKQKSVNHMLAHDMLPQNVLVRTANCHTARNRLGFSL